MSYANVMNYWKDSLLIGVNEIDDQHKKLIGAIGDLLNACSAGKGSAEIGKTLDFVISYTKEHFVSEERLQVKYAYPDIENHKKMHAGFIKSVTELKEEFKQKGPAPELTGKVNKILMDWLISHIKAEDMKIGKHIKSKGG